MILVPLVAVPDPSVLDIAHKAMQAHIPDDADPTWCRCGVRHPCHSRMTARDRLVGAGRLVIDRRPPRSAR
jgi:hypothetical protein